MTDNQRLMWLKCEMRLESVADQLQAMEVGPDRDRMLGRVMEMLETIHGLKS